MLKSRPAGVQTQSGGKARLERYQPAFLQVVGAGAKKPTNMAKVSEVLQKPEESPADFCER